MSFLMKILVFPFVMVWRVIWFALPWFRFRWIFNKLFGPPPMTMGGPPVDHSAPQPLAEPPG